MEELTIFIAVFWVGFSICYWIDYAFGENYVANLTKDEWDEFRLTELCFELNKSDMAVNILEEFCNERYGDIDSNYGDKIK